MADVDRGQLFLVGAFALAVLFVALAVLLNAAIFTENLSTQGRAPSPGDAVEYREAAVDAGGATVRGVNYHNNSSYGNLTAALDRGVEDWSLAAAKHRASEGHAASLRVANVTDGTRLAQDGERSFADDNGSRNWTVADGVRLRNFSLNVSEPSLEPEPTNQTPAAYQGSNVLRFTVEDDDGDTWTTYLHGDASDNVTVGVVDDTNSLTVCEVDPGADGYAVVDLTGARVGGRPCGALDFYGDADAPYTVGVVNATDGGGGETGSGTYSLVVDEENGTLDTAPFGSQPYATPAVYAATLNVTYRAPDTDYAARVRVAPGEPDA